MVMQTITIIRLTWVNVLLLGKGMGTLFRREKIVLTLTVLLVLIEAKLKRAEYR